MIVPVILSGGSGSRLWPLSRESYPKQFLALGGDTSLLQRTLIRAAQLPDVSGPLIIGNDQHRFLLAEQARELEVTPRAVVLEPFGRNTAPAATVAALIATAEGADPVLLILPADHLIDDDAAFQRAVLRAVPHAMDGALVTFGIVPGSAETGYGYIQAGESYGDGAHKVSRFVEKPDAETAAAYLAEGGYFWNSGMFVFRASSWLSELERLRPDMLAACRQAVDGATGDLDFLRLDGAAFAASPADSIDYAVMEHTGNAVVLPVSFGWNDVGAWSALHDTGNADRQGNVLRGDVIARDTRGSYIHAEHRLVATIGLDDLVVVETCDAVLVAHRDKVQDVKAVVETLKSRERLEARSHRKVYRPWGSYDSVDCEERFQVKRITVNPGAALSLQMHHHRAEHWVVVCGTAKVTRGDEVLMLYENQSTYIPPGTLHRLENPGKIPLELIEVQSGSYLGEDDIVRYDDTYGRHRT